MVKDHGRAEDITQEVFVSALRRMRQTERPIAFKPWIYEIAKNACIDAYRRGRRAEEVSFDADDRLSPSDHGRLVATGPEPDAAVDAKQELDHLCGAFGGLSDSHHEILVMRELEGLSYKDIGERMGMSRPAVESTLFRARKRLGEEYDELASGARCLRDPGDHRRRRRARGSAARDQRKLARHVSHCQPCRRLAAQRRARGRRARCARRVAEQDRRRCCRCPRSCGCARGGDEAAVGAPAAAATAGSRTRPAFAEPMSSGWGKAAAGLAALLVAGAGAGVTTIADGEQARRARHRLPRGRRAGPGARRRGGAAERSAAARDSGAVVRRRAAGKRERAADRRTGGAAAAARIAACADAGTRGADAGARSGPAAAGGAAVSGPRRPRPPAAASGRRRRRRSAGCRPRSARGSRGRRRRPSCRACRRRPRASPARCRTPTSRSRPSRPTPRNSPNPAEVTAPVTDSGRRGRRRPAEALTERLTWAVLRGVAQPGSAHRSGR